MQGQQHNRRTRSECCFFRSMEQTVPLGHPLGFTLTAFSCKASPKEARGTTKSRQPAETASSPGKDTWGPRSSTVGVRCGGSSTEQCEGSFGLFIRSSSAQTFLRNQLRGNLIIMKMYFKISTPWPLDVLKGTAKVCLPKREAEKFWHTCNSHTLTGRGLL